MRLTTKHFFLILLAGISHFSNAQLYAVSSGNFTHLKETDTLATTEIARYQTDLDRDGETDTIILSNLTALIGDPQEFTIICIRLGNGETYTFKNVQGASFHPQTKQATKNRLDSDKLYIPEITGDASFIFIRDYAYPDCTNRVQVLKADKTGVREVFNGNILIQQIAPAPNASGIVMEGYDPCQKAKKKIIRNFDF